MDQEKAKQRVLEKLKSESMATHEGFDGDLRDSRRPHQNAFLGGGMKCFVIMPFDESFDAVFEMVKSTATSAVPNTLVECYWLKDVRAAGRITDDIIRGLDEAVFCIADVSGHNPNVMWETGYAMALGKPTILIGQDTNSLPFDLKSHRIIEYATGAEGLLKDQLGEAIRQTLARYELRGSGAADLPSAKMPIHRTISVTGTMAADEAVVYRRLQHFLTPYMSETTMWLTGSFGTVDLTAIRLLLERGQKVTAVGYHRFDCAAKLRTLIEEGKVAFIDASVEPIPRGLKGPSERDILFCTKSDLVILLWDGKSSGTKQMIQYYQNQGIATLVTLV